MAGLLVVPLAGCGDASTDAGNRQLSGRAFVATSADGFDLPLGSDLQLAFDGFRMRITGACNTGAADYELRDGVLTVQPVAMTEIACAPELMTLDSDVVALLTGTPTVRVTDDDLIVAAGGRSLRLVDRTVLPADRPLLGTLWVVTTVIGGDTSSPAYSGATATVMFGDREAKVNGGCNLATVPVTFKDAVTKDAVTISDATAVPSTTVPAGSDPASSAAPTTVATPALPTIEFGVLSFSTKQPCEARVLELEYAVALTLQGSATYGVDGNELTIRHLDRALVLTAAAEA